MYIEPIHIYIYVYIHTVRERTQNTQYTSTWTLGHVLHLSRPPSKLKPAVRLDKGNHAKSQHQTCIYSISLTLRCFNQKLRTALSELHDVSWCPAMDRRIMFKEYMQYLSPWLRRPKLCCRQASAEDLLEEFPGFIWSLSHDGS